MFYWLDYLNIFSNCMYIELEEDSINNITDIEIQRILYKINLNEDNIVDDILYKYEDEKEFIPIDLDSFLSNNYNNEIYDKEIKEIIDTWFVLIENDYLKPKDKLYDVMSKTYRKEILTSKWFSDNTKSIIFTRYSNFMVPIKHVKRSN